MITNNITVMPKAIERREFPRFYISDISLELVSKDKLSIAKGEVLTISKKGLSGVFDVELAIMETYIVKVKIKKDEKKLQYLCKGRIMWSHKTDDNQYKCGIELSGEEIDEKNNLIKQLIIENSNLLEIIKR
ncbi:PilZ domain-containing protein [bacterium]